MQSNGRDRSWEFFLHSGIWKWRTTAANGDRHDGTGAFVTLAQALDAAAKLGFDVELHHWLVRADGRLTEFRPGQPGVNMPDGSSQVRDASISGAADEAV